jgi:hypothetical protein
LVVMPVQLAHAQSPSVAAQPDSVVTLGTSVGTLAVSAATEAHLADTAVGARRSTYGSCCHQ